MISPIMIGSSRVTLRWTTPDSLATTGVTRHGGSLMTVFLPWRISGELWTLFSGQGQSFLSCFMLGYSRVYSDRLLNSDSHLACFIVQLLE